MDLNDNREFINQRSTIRLSITRLKLACLASVRSTADTINDKTLDYEIETIMRIEEHKTVTAINDKTLDYEIETRLRTFSRCSFVARSTIRLSITRLKLVYKDLYEMLGMAINDKTLDYEIETGQADDGTRHDATNDQR